MANAPQPGEYTPQVNTISPVMVRPQAASVSNASGIAAIGNAIGDIGNILQAKAKADAATYANDQLTNLRVQTQAAFEKAKETAKDGADGFTDSVLGEFDKQTGVMLKQSKDPLANKALQAGVNQLRANLQENAIGWQAQQGVLYRATSIQNNTQKLSGVVQNDPTQLHVSIEQQLLTLNNSNLPPSARLKLAQEVTETLTKSAAIGLAKQDPFSVLEQLKDPAKAGEAIAGLDADTRTSLQRVAEQQAAQNTANEVVAQYRDSGPRAGQSAYAAIDKLKVSDDVKEQARKFTQSGLGDLQNQRRQQYADTLIGLEERIASGRPLPNDRTVAASLYHNAALSPEQYASSLASIDRAEMQQVTTDTTLDVAKKAYMLGTPLDPKSDGKDVNDLFNAFTTGVEPGSAEWKNRAVDIATKTGVVASTAVDWARANLISGDPDKAAQAAETISRLNLASPRGAGFTIDEKTNALADTVSTMVNAGTPAQQAVEIARKNSEMADSQSKLLDEKYRKLKPQESSAGALRSLLSGNKQYDNSFFSNGTPDIPLGMNGEFNELTRNYFDFTGGDLKQAQKLAAQDIQKTWGVTTVNGKRELMKYAPETVVPGLTGDMVRMDIDKSVPDIKGARLAPYADTERTHGVLWNLVAPNKNGMMDVVVDKDNNPLVYALPGSQSGYDMAKEKAVAEARAKQKAKQEADKARIPAITIGAWQ